MKSLVKSIFLLSVVALVSACGGGSKADKIAKEICNCSEPIIEIQEKAMDLMDDPEAYEQLMTESQATLEDAEKCMDALGEKYESDMEDSKLEAEVKESLSKKCPEVAAMMEGGM